MGGKGRGVCSRSRKGKQTEEPKPRLRWWGNGMRTRPGAAREAVKEKPKARPTRLGSIWVWVLCLFAFAKIDLGPLGTLPVPAHTAKNRGWTNYSFAPPNSSRTQAAGDEVARPLPRVCGVLRNRDWRSNLDFPFYLTIDPGRSIKSRPFVLRFGVWGFEANGRGPSNALSLLSNQACVAENPNNGPAGRNCTCPSLSSLRRVTQCC